MTISHGNKVGVDGDAEISKRDLDGLGLFGSMLGHIGDGNFHETILFDGDRERGLVSKCVHDMVRRALEMEGTCTVRPPPLHRGAVANGYRANTALAWERRSSW